MTGTAFLLLALAMVAAVGDWIAVDRQGIDERPSDGVVAVNRGAKLAEYVCKPLTLALMVAAALALDPADSTVRSWFVAALVLSLLGDVFLMLPNDAFVPGLASFLLGHIAYVIGFVADDVSPQRLGLGCVLVAVAILLIGLRIVRAVQDGEEPDLAKPVLAYMVVISAMVACAVGVGNVFAIVGAGLFYASDSLIAWNRFIGRTRRGHLAIITTYHLGQLGLVLSLI